MGKTRVGIIFGGRSAEHEVSLQSAKNILDALDKERFDVSLIGIDKQGLWHLCDTAGFLLNADDPKRIALDTSGPLLSVVPGAERNQLVAADGRELPQIDVVFPIVHGTLGEDGSLQGLLRMANLPFVGSGVLGSAVAMDKDVAKRLLRDAGLPVAPFVCFTPIRRSPSSMLMAMMPPRLWFLKSPRLVFLRMPFAVQDVAEIVLGPEAASPATASGWSI